MGGIEQIIANTKDGECLFIRWSDGMEGLYTVLSCLEDGTKFAIIAKEEKNTYFQHTRALCAWEIVDISVATPVPGYVPVPKISTCSC